MYYYWTVKDVDGTVTCEQMIYVKDVDETVTCEQIIYVIFYESKAATPSSIDHLPATSQQKWHQIRWYYYSDKM